MNSLPPNFPTKDLSDTGLYKVQWYYRKYMDEYYAEYGFGHYLLAAYAAVPALLTPDLLYKIWQNFNAFKWGGDAASIHRVAVPDLLLSPLCREIGFELYEIHPEIRMALLQWLNTEAATPIWIKRELRTITQIAAFVEYYYEIPNAAGQRWGAGYVETQALDAKSFLNPAAVADTLLQKLQAAAYAQQESEMLRVMDLFVKTKKRVELLGEKNEYAFSVMDRQAVFMEAWKTLIQKNNTSFVERLNNNPDLLQLLTQTNTGGIEIKIAGGIVEQLTLVAERKVLALIIGTGIKELPGSNKLQSLISGNVFENSANLIAKVFEDFIPKEQFKLALLTGFNATKFGILRAWEEMCSSATENDDVILYIAANAVADNGSCLVICADSENHNNNKETLLADKEIGGIAATSKSSSIAAIIQADHAGTPHWLDTAKPNHIIFASCKHEKKAGNFILEDKRRSYFAFTYALVESLRKNRVSVRELFADTLRRFEILVREAALPKLAIKKIYKEMMATSNPKETNSWQEYAPQLICNRESCQSLFSTVNKRTATLQDLLRQYGYADARTTGVWDKETAAALSLFCNENNIPKTLLKQEYINRLITEKESKAASFKPVFVLIFSDPKKRLTMQLEERTKILEIIKPIEKLVEIITLDNPDITTLANALKLKANRNRVEMIYYSGNDDKGNYVLNDGSFTPGDVAPLLAFQENIKLMVSNTCNSAFFAEAITQMGVSGAIGAPQIVMDDVASQFGQSLFRWITEGKSIGAFMDNFNNNQSLTSNFSFLFFKAGWLPEEAVINWEKFGGKKPIADTEIYSLIVGFNYNEEDIDNLTQKNIGLMNTWLKGLSESRGHKQLVNTEALTVDNIDIDKAIENLYQVAEKSTTKEKTFIFYLTGKGLQLKDYPVFCLPRLTTEVEYSCIDIREYFWALCNSDVFTRIVMCYDLQEEKMTTHNGLLPEFQSLSVRSKDGLLAGHFSERDSIKSTGNPSGDGNEAGLFTRQLLDGLNGRAADSEKNITANSITNYLRETVPGMTTNRMGEKDFMIMKPTNKFLQKVIIHFTPACLDKGFRLLRNLPERREVVNEIKVNIATVEYDLKPGTYTAEIGELLLEKIFDVAIAAHPVQLRFGWKFLNKYICVIGSRYSLSKEKIATAQALGKFLANEGYGLMTGGWQGIDKIVMTAYAEVAEALGAEKHVLKQIVTDDKIAVFEKGVIEKVAGKSWNEHMIKNSFAIISIGGKGFTSKLFYEVRESRLPFIPLPHTKGDSLKIYHELLNAENPVLPKEKLEALGNFETETENGFWDTVKALLGAVANTIAVS